MTTENTDQALPTTKEDLFAYFDELGIKTQTVNHDPVFTVEESKALRGKIDGAHSKNLFLKDKKGALFLLVAEESTPISMKHLHPILGSARLSFGKPELLFEKLGVRPGSVTPFSVINDKDGDVTLILDEGLMNHERLNFHPLINDATTAISRDDLMKFAQASGHPPQILNCRAPQEVET